MIYNELRKFSIYKAIIIPFRKDTSVHYSNPINHLFALTKLLVALTAFSKLFRDKFILIHASFLPLQPSCIIRLSRLAFTPLHFTYRLPSTKISIWISYKSYSIPNEQRKFQISLKSTESCVVLSATVTLPYCLSSTHKLCFHKYLTNDKML